MSTIDGGRRGKPFNNIHWSMELKDNIKKTNFKGSWKDAVSSKNEINKMAKENKKFNDNIIKIEKIEKKEKSEKKEKIEKKSTTEKFNIPFWISRKDQDEFLKKNKFDKSPQSFIDSIKSLFFKKNEVDVAEDPRKEIFTSYERNYMSTFYLWMMQRKYDCYIPNSCIDGHGDLLYNYSKAIMNIKNTNYIALYNTLLINQYIAVYFPEKESDGKYFINGNIQDFINESSNRFILYYLNLFGIPDHGKMDNPKGDVLYFRHRNSVIIDKKYKTLERYEPHGLFQRNKNDFDSRIDDILEKIANDNGLEYLKNAGGYLSDYLNVDKFLESLSPNELKKLGSVTLFRLGINNKKGLQTLETDEIRGFCTVWSLLYLELRVANPDMTEKDVLKNFIDFFESNQNYLIEYIAFYLKKSNDELLNIFKNTKLDGKKIYEVLTFPEMYRTINEF